MIPFLDLKRQYSSIREEINAAVLSVLESSQFILGRDVAAFEEEFAHWNGCRHAIGVNSGTSAIHLALLACGVGPGDEVLTVPFTFVATTAAIEYVGARPIFVDIDPRTYTMDPELIEAAITRRTRAILPVHLFGHPADMDPILEIADRHGLVVIEDAAQAHGAEYKGRRTGTMGAAGCFSFYPGKNLGACGEGGMVTTSVDSIARKVRMLRDWGADRKYHHTMKGFNYRLEAIQGAVLRVKLRYLSEWTSAREARADFYSHLLTGFGVAAPEAMPWARHAWHVYAIRTKDRQSMQTRLEACGIQTNIHYPYPIHLLPAYADLGYSEGMFPESEAAAREELSLPMYPELEYDQIELICDSVQESCLAAFA